MPYLTKFHLLVFLMTLSTIGFSQTPAPAQVADQFLAAWESKKTLPAISKLMPGVSLEQAYEVQQLWVKRSMKTKDIGGIKGGVVGVESQQSYGLKEPLGGVLRGKGRMDKRAKNVIRLKKFPGLKLETEIGFVIGKRLDKAPTNIEEFRSYVSAIVPVMELVAGTWDNPGGTPNAANIAATNLSAAGYLVGTPVAVNSLDPREAVLKFSKDGNVLHEGKGSEAWHGPWETAFWLAQFAQRQGIVLEPGQVIISGAVGKVHDGLPGEYVLEAGALGEIRFVIK